MIYLPQYKTDPALSRGAGSFSSFRGYEVRRGSKIKAGVAARITEWDKMPASGYKGSNTKLVRQDKGTAAYHKPGSQSGRKGYGKRKKVTKK